MGSLYFVGAAFAAGFVFYFIKSAVGKARFPKWNWNTDYEELSREIPPNHRWHPDNNDEEIVTAEAVEEKKPYVKPSVYWRPIINPLGTNDPPPEETVRITSTPPYIKENGSIDWLALKSLRVQGSPMSVDSYWRPHTESNGQIGGSAWSHPKNVSKEFRLLPPPKKQLFGSKYPLVASDLFAVARQHYIDSNNGEVYQCGKHRTDDSGSPMWVGSCPICDHYNKLWKQISEVERSHSCHRAEEMKVEARKFKPHERYYYNVSVKEGDAFTRPKIWSVGKSVHQQIVKLILQAGDVTDLENGRNLYVTTDCSGSFMRSEVHLCHPSSFTRNRIGWANVLANQWDLDDVIEKQGKSLQEAQAIIDKYQPIRGETAATAEAWEIQRNGKKICPGDVNVGDWVFWKTKKGEMSVRPSVIFKKKDGQLQLKYQSGDTFHAFLVAANKCVKADVKPHQFVAMWEEWRRCKPLQGVFESI